jgi:gliding motility-associated-like protein
MRKAVTGLLAVLIFSISGYANHLKGGWIQYTYKGAGTAANTSRYEITVKQYLDCNSTQAQRDPSVFLGIFDGSTNALFGAVITIPLSGTDIPDKKSFSPCLSQPYPRVCYIIDRYTTTVDLPDNAAGYTLSVQRCCRIINIKNVSGNSNDIGITYSTKIPGVINGTRFSSNSSPVFAQKDTVVVCYNAPFTFDFSAADPDGDQLTYSFCDGSTGGDNTQAGARPNPPSNPPYSGFAYGAGFSGGTPLGTAVTIDPNTGIISGVAPSVAGDYIVAVCATEYRNNVIIGITKKEIHITVADCSLSAAALKPTYITCNGTTLTFQNESTSSSISSYLWDFGVPNLTTDTSTNPTPSYDFLQSGKDSGTYTIKLKVSSAAGCQDSATATVKVYPGFKAGMNITGTCYINNYQFFDATTTKYGTVNSWRWDFGDLTSTADTATRKDTAWKYPAATTANVRLITTNSKGCIDSVTRTLTVLDRPSLNLPFRDTLICSIDTLMLKANVSSGTILWTPVNGPNRTRILNSNTNSPLVFPRDTTKYYVSVNDNGCANTDSVTVNVLQFISVKAGTDTGICRTDTFRLHPISDALSYVWTASTGEKVTANKYPLVQPLSNTRYYVTANLGKCQARDSVNVKVSPYPTANAGADVTICYGSRVQLNAVSNGAVLNWKPTNTLINFNGLNPIAGPTNTTAYILTARDTAGCLKVATDTIVVTVVPPILANAGRDTSVVPGQPLQLNATGGTTYLWTPATGLSDPNIANPVATLDNTIDEITYKVRVANGDGSCFAEDDVVVKVYKTGPDILVPSGFTPNKDGRNEIIRPTLIGITQLNFFSIYNRWGQLVFNTNEPNKGWDGDFGGVPQPSGTYIYQVQGTDYSGKKILRKGTVVLVR